MRRRSALAAPLVVLLCACQGDASTATAKGGPAAEGRATPAVAAATEAAALRYAAPSCALRYAFTMNVGAPAAKSGLPLRGELVLEGIDEGRLALRVDSLDAEPSLPPVLADSKGARFILELADDGRSLTAVERPSAFWDSFGTFGGLHVFWPTLPEGADEGATATWTVPLPRAAGAPQPPVAPKLVPEAAAGRPAEPTGAEPATPTTPPPKFAQGEVKLDRWGAQDGRALASLSASWTHEATASGADAQGDRGIASAKVREIGFRSTARAQATYRVLASGRLLSAEFSHEQQVQMSLAGQAAPPTTIRSTAEIRLIEACDGPVLAAPKPAPAPAPAPAPSGG
ncbi:MAG: hypothetical protein R3A79_13745 [Nannocystaceae bacterium]